MPDTYKQSFKQTAQDNIELSVYNCGQQSCEKGYTWGPGIRDHYLIHLIISGKGSYTVNNQAFELSAGDVFISKPNQLITYSADETDPWEYYWVGFNGSCANRLVCALPFKENQPVYHCSNIEVVKASLSSIFSASGTSVRSEAIMVGYLYIFIAQLMEKNPSNDSRAAITGSKYVMNAIKYIQFNYSRDISIDDISKSVGVSRSHLYRVFINNVGKSPIDYLTDYRINEACFLIKNSGLSIAEIAISVGFFDQFYFSRVFKKSKGVPPSRYISREV